MVTASPLRTLESVTLGPANPTMPVGGWRGWAGPLGVAALALLLRLPSLGRPADLVFDETYYAKDAIGMLRYGTEQETVEDANERILASNGDIAALDIFTGDPSYVVHPPLGKWIIASGEAVFGATPFGWRIAMLVVGVVAVLVLTRVARRLLRSNLWGSIVGLLMAVDGLAIVMSRTALLDNALMLFVLCAFGALLIDRDQQRERVVANLPPSWYRGVPVPQSLLSGVRPWRWVAALMLGLACGVKWSGLWFVAAFGLLTVVWDLGLRRWLGVDRPWRRTFVAAVPTGLVWIAIVLVVYTATWTSWFITDTGYNRQWAEGAVSAVPWVPETLRSWWHYHAEAWSFHTGLTSEHSYAANAWGWPVLARPTAFFYEGEGLCGEAKCSQEVLALGNPIIWWAAVLALVHQLWRWAGRRDWRAGAVLAGFVAGWAPWLLFQDRPVFSFYAIVFLPFMLLALGLSLQTFSGARGSDETTQSANAAGTRPPSDRPQLVTQTGLRMGIVVFLAVAIAISGFFYPIWVGEVIPYDQWQLRMWLPSWV